MGGSAVKLFKKAQKGQHEISAESYRAFDACLRYMLERRYLKIPEFTNVLVDASLGGSGEDLQTHLRNNVRLMKVIELSLDSEVSSHLPAVENAITSMRDMGYSLVFVVQGNKLKTSVYLGISKFAAEPVEITSAMASYKSVWMANFPGSEFKEQDQEPIIEVADTLNSYKAFGVLTGIPSLKRNEDTGSFVQGLERLIRTMRGKQYCWISIADPIPEDSIRASIETCQQLQSDIHHLIKTSLTTSKSVSETVTVGMFGMFGEGQTNTTSHTDSTSDTQTKSQTHTQNHLEGYQRAGNVVGSVLGLAGAVAGSFICPGIGTAVGGALGSGIGGLVNSIGGAITGKNGFADSVTNAVGKTVSSADTISKAMSTQKSVGGFGSFGMTFTSSTTVGVELLNRKAEYAEAALKRYEERLQEGVSIGLWNLGHYFCAFDEETYGIGSGAVASLFTGMDVNFEPPRSIRVPESFRDVLKRFNNVYLQYADGDVSVAGFDPAKTKIENHPFGVIFNGPATPVSTKELAVATPVALNDVEGVSVTERASFGVDIPEWRLSAKSLSLGTVLDRGNETSHRYKFSLANLTKHVGVFGLTGSGKTNTVHHLLTQLWAKHKIPFLVIEPAKAEYRALSALDDFKNDLLVFSAGVDVSSVSPLRLNPFDFNPGRDDDAHRIHILTHIDRLKAVFNASFPMYASMPYILEEAIHEVYRERGWDLSRSVNRYVDIYSEDFSDYVPTIQDLYYKVDSIVLRKGYFKEQQMNIQAALKARLSSLMIGAKGSLFNSRRSIPDEDLFDRPVVIELENMGDDDEKAFLMGLLVARLYEYRKAKFEASKINSDKPFLHSLVIEEAHRLLSNVPEVGGGMEVANVKGKSVSAFVDMLAEIRAYGQSVFVVDQLPSRVSPNIVKGTGAKIIHRLLAKDDRESVGETMGLNAEQISDLCMLRVGQCVVSQDGDRKAYLCSVRKSEAHELRIGGEFSAATKKYVDTHSQLFEQRIDDLDLDNDRIRAHIYKTMMATAISNDEVDLKACIGAVDVRLAMAYWNQIARAIWNYFLGDYRAFLLFQHEGVNVLSGEEKSVRLYRVAASEYFGKSNLNSRVVSGFAGVAYDQLFAMTEIMSAINRQYDLIKNCDDSIERLGKAISKCLLLLLPDNKILAERVKKPLVSEIISRINPAISIDSVLASVK